MPNPNEQLPVEKMLSNYTHQTDVLASTEGWETPNLFIVEKAIIISVKTGINMNETNAALVPQFSINARIIGENASFSNIPEKDMPDWYPPLFPNTVVSVPEVGEMVLILKENTAKSDKGWWIGRINDTDRISLKLAGSQIANATPMERYGLPFKVSAVNKRSIQKSSYAADVKYQIPARLGDVFLQGRSGSFLRNSYNPNYGNMDKPGVLEMGILFNKPYGESTTASVGKTRTKTIHLSNAYPSDLGIQTKKVTINPSDKITHSNGTFGESRKNIIANFANDIYNISTSRDAEILLHRQVLGEKLNRFLRAQDLLLIDVMDTLKDMTNIIQMMFDSYVDHTHTIPEINIDIPDKEVETRDVINRGIELEPQPDISVFVPSFTVSVPPSGEREVTRTVDTPVGTRRYTETIAGSPGSSVVIPSKFITVPQPAKAVNKGYRTVKTKKVIEFDKITVGGSSKPRKTTTIETDKTTEEIQTNVNKTDDKFLESKNNFIALMDRLSDNLSKRNYIN